MFTIIISVINSTVELGVNITEATTIVKEEDMYIKLREVAFFFLFYP